MSVLVNIRWTELAGRVGVFTLEMSQILTITWLFGCRAAWWNPVGKPPSHKVCHEILSAVICWDGWVNCHSLTLTTCLNKGKCSPPLPINLQLGVLLRACFCVSQSGPSRWGMVGLSVCLCVFERLHEDYQTLRGHRAGIKGCLLTDTHLTTVMLSHGDNFLSH